MFCHICRLEKDTWALNILPSSMICLRIVKSADLPFTHLRKPPSNSKRTVLLKWTQLWHNAVHCLESVGLKFLHCKGTKLGSLGQFSCFFFIVKQCNILKGKRNQICQNKGQCFLWNINSTILHHEIGIFEDIEGYIGVNWVFPFSQKTCMPVLALFGQNH